MKRIICCIVTAETQKTTKKSCPGYGWMKGMLN